MPRVVDHQVQREEVLKATGRTIANFGIQGVTVRRIAAEAGVSTGFITHYFKDKNDILASALRLSNERSTERVKERVKGLSGLAALRALVEAVIPADEDRRLEWCIWLSFWGFGEQPRGLNHQRRHGTTLWRDGLLHFLREAEAAGELAAGLDLAYQAERMTVLIGGIGLQSRAVPTEGFEAWAMRLVDDEIDSLRARQN